MGLFFKRKKIVEFKAPVHGETIDLADVPDQVFADKIVGDGMAFLPEEGVLFAPVSAEVVQVFPTKHAIGLRTKEGLEVLIHIGLDTVELKGEGFTCFIQGQQVKAGEKMMEFDLNFLAEQGKSSITPLVITNMQAVKELQVHHGKVNPQTTVMRVKI